MAPMTIRKMLKTDIDAVHRIETLSFRTPWSLESFEQEVEENHLAYYAVVDLEGVVVGYGGLWQVFDEVHVTNVAIDPEYRGRGLSRPLMLHLMDHSKQRGALRMTLEVRVSNTTAIALYQSLGFETEGVRPKYYQDTQEDALILWVTL